MNCELCGREIVDGHESRHHIIPRACGHGSCRSVAIVFLHPVCHKTIHALFTNKELCRYGAASGTLDTLKNHSDVRRFVGWIKNKPTHFYSNTKIKKKYR